jgi:hypothetical protein
VWFLPTWPGVRIPPGGPFRSRDTGEFRCVLKETLETLETPEIASGSG